MKKPTYAQLVALVEYLSVPADYENLPLLDAPKAAIEYCIKNRKSHIFSDSTEFDAEQEPDSVADDICELLEEYSCDFDDEQCGDILKTLTENRPH